eukprot:jgi/Mesvir1/172/Mv13529-RA.1
MLSSPAAVPPTLRIVTGGGRAAGAARAGDDAHPNPMGGGQGDRPQGEPWMGRITALARSGEGPPPSWIPPQRAQVVGRGGGGGGGGGVQQQQLQSSPGGRQSDDGEGEDKLGKGKGDAVSVEMARQIMKYKLDREETALRVADLEKRLAREMELNTEHIEQLRLTRQRMNQRSMELMSAESRLTNLEKQNVEYAERITGLTALVKQHDEAGKQNLKKVAMVKQKCMALEHTVETQAKEIAALEEKLRVLQNQKSELERMASAYREQSQAEQELQRSRAAGNPGGTPSGTPPILSNIQRAPRTSSGPLLSPLLSPTGGRRSISRDNDDGAGVSSPLAGALVPFSVRESLGGATNRSEEGQSPRTGGGLVRGNEHSEGSEGEEGRGGEGGGLAAGSESSGAKRMGAKPTGGMAGEAKSGGETNDSGERGKPEDGEGAGGPGDTSGGNGAISPAGDGSAGEQPDEERASEGGGGDARGPGESDGVKPNRGDGEGDGEGEEGSTRSSGHGTGPVSQREAHTEGADVSAGEEGHRRANSAVPVGGKASRRRSEPVGSAAGRSAHDAEGGGDGGGGGVRPVPPPVEAFSGSPAAKGGAGRGGAKGSHESTSSPTDLFNKQQWTTQQVYTKSTKMPGKSPSPGLAKIKPASSNSSNAPASGTPGSASSASPQGKAGASGGGSGAGGQPGGSAAAARAEDGGAVPADARDGDGAGAPSLARWQDVGSIIYGNNFVRISPNNGPGAAAKPWLVHQPSRCEAAAFIVFQDLPAMRTAASGQEAKPPAPDCWCNNPTGCLLELSGDVKWKGRTAFIVKASEARERSVLGLGS